MSTAVITLREKLLRYAEEMYLEKNRCGPPLGRNEEDFCYHDAAITIFKKLAELVDEQMLCDERVAGAVLEETLHIAWDQVDRGRSFEEIMPKIESLAAQIADGTVLDPRK